MRLIKRLIELAFVILVISLFMKNKDVQVSITYFGLSEPITLAFWELVTICISVGIIIAAVGDFITQLKWVKERRRMVKTDKEHQQTVDGLNRRIKELETESETLKKELKEKPQDTEPMRQIEASASLPGLEESATEFHKLEESIQQDDRMPEEPTGELGEELEESGEERDKF